MTFTIEPMLTLGTIEYDVWPDGWTVVTKDRARTAQFEHTILVTDTRRRDPHAALITLRRSGKSGPARTTTEATLHVTAREHP